MDPGLLRPLRVGETLDAAIKIYRGHFGVLVRAVAVIALPLALFTTLVYLSLPDTSGPVSRIDETTGEVTFDGGDAAAAVGGTVVLGIGGFLAGQVATAACFAIVSGAYLDERRSWKESLRFAVRRLGPLAWLTLVSGLGLGLGLLLCVVPGVYLYVMWAVATPVLLFEDRRGTKALGRSRQLLQGRFWPVFGVLVLTQILSRIVAGGLGAVLGGVILTSDSALVAAVARGLSQAFSTVLVTPFTAAVTTVLYFDALVRKEGFDLARLAAGVGVELPDGWTPPEAQRSGSGGDEPPFWPPPPGWRPGGAAPS